MKIPPCEHHFKRTCKWTFRLPSRERQAGAPDVLKYATRVTPSRLYFFTLSNLSIITHRLDDPKLFIHNWI